MSLVKKENYYSYRRNTDDLSIKDYTYWSRDSHVHNWPGHGEAQITTETQ